MFCLLFVAVWLPPPRFSPSAVGDALVALNVAQPFADAPLVTLFLRSLGLIMVGTSTIFEPLPLPAASAPGTAIRAPPAPPAAGGKAKQRSKPR